MKMATELGVELCLLGSLLLEVKISYGCLPRLGFPSGSVIKNLLANTGTAGDLGSTPGLGRYPGRDWDGNRLQNSCLENPMGRGGWRAIIHMVAKSQTRLSGWAHMQAHLRLRGVLPDVLVDELVPRVKQCSDWAGCRSVPVFIKLWSGPMPVR